MSRKIIDYIVVEVRKDPNEYDQHYSLAFREEGLKIARKIKNIGEGIIIKENKKRLLEEEIKYIDTLLQTVKDFSTYKIPAEKILFYQEQFNALHPINSIKYYDFFDENEDEYHRVELKKGNRQREDEIAKIDRENEMAKSEIQKLKIKENAILENNQKLDFENFRTDFEKSVIYYLEKGYEPQGGIATRYDAHYFFYYQAMVKYED